MSKIVDSKSFHMWSSATGKAVARPTVQPEQADDQSWKTGVFVEMGCQRWAWTAEDTAEHNHAVPSKSVTNQC